MHGVAGQKEREHVAHTGVLGELVEASDLQPTLRFGGDVEAHVGQQVAAGYGVGSVPGVAQRITGGGAAPGDYGVLGVHSRVYDGLLGVASAKDGTNDPAVAAVFGSLLGLHGGCLEEPRDHGGDHLHVAYLLCCGVEEHIAVLGWTAAVPPLEEVVHHHAHLAPLAAY